MKNTIIGWDIGGAHIKAAILNHGKVIQVLQQPCPLWKGIEQLHTALTTMLSQLSHSAEQHCVTMTGELVDCFSSREQGVHAIIQAMTQYIPVANMRVYAGQHGFLTIDAIQPEHILAIASANWLASASVVALQFQHALLVDIGSTTTDILLITHKKVAALGYTDYERLVSGELVYTGIVRTSVMALTQQAVFNGKHMGLMAEHFATLADVYRLTGDLTEAHDQSDTADGAEKSAIASARRLSRLTGYDFNETDWSLWLEFASTLKQQQQEKIWSACQRQLERVPSADKPVLIGAGIGRFLLADCAEKHGFIYHDFNEILPLQLAGSVVDAADCAPAVAVAYLFFYVK